MKAFVSHVVTYWDSTTAVSTHNAAGDPWPTPRQIPGLGFRKQMHGKYLDHAFVCEIDYDGRCKMSHYDGDPNMIMFSCQLSNALDAAGLNPNSGQAYAIYNADVEGPISGAMLDVVNKEVEVD